MLTGTAKKLQHLPERRVVRTICTPGLLRLLETADGSLEFVAAAWFAESDDLAAKLRQGVGLDRLAGPWTALIDAVGYFESGHSFHHTILSKIRYAGKNLHCSAEFAFSDKVLPRAVQMRQRSFDTPSGKPCRTFFPSFEI